MSADAPRVVLLCGGLGTRMREETEFRPKPMVEVGGQPLLWHIMKLYASHGFADFVLCLGYKGFSIKQYFASYLLFQSDVTLDLRTGETVYERPHSEDWRVTLVDTGDDAMTGARIKRVERHLGGSEIFLCTYGDGLADVDIARLVAFHRQHGGIATVTGVAPPSRFGALGVSGTRVVEFAEKPAGEGGLINGGYFVFDRRFLGWLSSDPTCTLEREPLERLAAAGHLHVYPHDGFWQPADTLRDVEQLRALWSTGRPPWRVWDAVRPAA